MSSSGQVQPVFTMADTGGSGLQIVSEKLSETNYASWTVVVELYVEGHDKLDILHGTKVKPDEKDPSFRTWWRDNIQLMTWMLNSVNSGIKQVIFHNKTAYDMWKMLEQMYGRRHDMLRTYQISSQIFKLEQGSMSVTNYFATLKGLWDEFNYYRMENWSSTDDHQRYLKLLEKDRIIKFLDGLTAEFENLKGQILSLDPTPSLEQVYYKILSEEGRKRTMNNKGISAVGPPIGETSVFIGSANKFRPGGTKRQGDRFCRHCKRTNHDSDFCWEKYPEKKPEKFKHNAKKAPNSSNIAVQKIENKETIGSSVPSTTGLSSTDIVNLQHLLFRLQASSSASTPTDSTPFQAHTGIRGLGLSVTGPNFYSPWVIDSGATDHMTNAANSFISYSLSSGQEKVIIANGTKATVASKVVPQVISSPIPLDAIENRKDAPSLGKDAPSLGAQPSPDIITYKRRRHKQEPTIDRLVESDALAPDPVKQLSSSVESTAPLNMNELNLPVAVRKGKLGSRPVSTPIEVNHDLTSSSGEDLTSLEKGTYQRLVGKLLYLSMTRPDITYAVSVVSQYMHAPKTIHMKAVDRILRFNPILDDIRGHVLSIKPLPSLDAIFSEVRREEQSRRIMLGGSSMPSASSINFDASVMVAQYPNSRKPLWCDHCNRPHHTKETCWKLHGCLNDRRSTSVYYSFVLGNLLTWRSKKQSVVARSIAEAELRSTALGICGALWLKQLLEELHIPKQSSIIIWCDNKAVISISHSPVHHDRTKHVEIGQHFIKEKIDEGINKVSYVPTTQQVAYTYKGSL
ncbi:hypothetical protein ZIOFF_033929 [Zingiber officinale]|uniref:Retrovirus-related Pol polyprotein from transposon TNT 1-94-like beta-barrel domain-containing protein n=1 Tax=Zingiber officinale TaxID=94328 RepID=A0A8J5GQ05_ZINOF|nr:hypothetical protein ZIOFF_033929 [Zingiber officinale]